MKHVIEQPIACIHNSEMHTQVDQLCHKISADFVLTLLARFNFHSDLGYKASVALPHLIKY